MNFFQFNDDEKSAIALSTITHAWKENKGGVDGEGNTVVYYIKIPGSYFKYKDRKNDRDEDYNRLIKVLNKGESKMEVLKQYFQKHQDTFLTIGVIIILDHFLFGGAFREKIQHTIEKILSSAQKKLEGGK